MANSILAHRSAGSTTPQSRTDFNPSASIIRLVPQLNCAALSARPKQDKQLILWYCLRSIDSDTGRGVLLQDDAIEVLEKHYGYKRQTAYKHLRAGDGAYWKIYHSTRNGQTYIIIGSLYKVATYLDAGLTKGARFVEMKVEGLPPSSHTQARRAILYNIGVGRAFNRERNDPISRQSLKEKTGVQERQQRRYDALQEQRQGHSVRTETKAYYREPETFKLRIYKRIVDKGLISVLTIQLPNRYRTWYTGSSRGMLCRVSSMLNGRDKSLISGEANAPEGRQRRYYSGFKAYYNAHIKGQNVDRECFYPCQSSSIKYVVGSVW